MSKVLVVDDDSAVRSLFVTLLSRHGFDVVAARNGTVAKKKFDREDFSLVLTDICMPDCDGNALVNHVKQMKVFVPVVACTGGADWVSSKFDMVLSKPIKAKHLIKVVNSFVCQCDMMMNSTGRQNCV